jgi:hypothetical protein
MYVILNTYVYKLQTIHNNQHNTGPLRPTRPILTILTSSVNYMDKNNFNIHDGAIGTQHIYIYILGISVTRTSERYSPEDDRM